MASSTPRNPAPLRRGAFTRPSKTKSVARLLMGWRKCRRCRQPVHKDSRAEHWAFCGEVERRPSVWRG